MERIVNLTYDEKNVLASVYGRQFLTFTGYNPNRFEAILDLTAQENKFFSGRNFVSPHFFTQTLYKVEGNLSPINFNLIVRRTIKNAENLRANFCKVGLRTVKVIKPAVAVNPEIIFRNMVEFEAAELDDEFRKIFDADMRRDLDLRHDPLIRFAVYKTADREFAVLVTVAQVIAESFDAENFFGEISSLPKIAPKNSFEDLPAKNAEAVREYWAKILDNPPPPAKLPFQKRSGGMYRQNAYRIKIPADILSDLRGFAQSNTTMLTAILQSAWGFMLQAINKQRDCLFCQILSSSHGSEKSLLNIIPVRLTSAEDLTVEQIIRKQFRQLVVSQPYSCFDWDDIAHLPGGERKLFDHFLNFAEFNASELNYVATPAEVRGKVISRNSWDAQGMKLGVYFRYSEKNLSLTFLYDRESFTIYGGERIAQLYKLVLQQVIVDRNAKFADFSASLDKRIKMLTDGEEISHEDNAKKIRNFLYQLPILQGRFEGTANLFSNNAELMICFEGDRISGEILKEKFIFVMNGKLARNVDAGDGWYNPIDVIGRNSFVNPTSLLEKRRLTLSAEVLTDQAELLTIPRSAMLEVLRDNSDIALSIMNYALTQMERYQLLWLQS